MTDYTPSHAAQEWTWPAPQQPPAPPKSNRRLLVGLIAAGVLVAGGVAAAIVVSSGSSAASGISVHGSFVLIDPDEALDWSSSSSCSGSGGYSDLAEGAEVVISDDAGRTLAITELGPGSTGGASAAAGRCTFSFTTSVPAGKRFYGVSISHRGTVKFTEAQIARAAVSVG